MKLQYQLNAAFTALLMVIMAVSGYVIYALILDLLIQDEQRQLEQKGELLVRILNEDERKRDDIQKFSIYLQDQNLQLFLYDSNQNIVLHSSLSAEITNGFIQKNDFSNNEKGLWEYNSEKFVTSRILFYPESSGIELILLTPLTDLQKVQHSFITRMFVVFIIGAVVAILLSSFLTNKLVTPLSRLKRQLKKIELRQFDQLEPIKATGEIKEVEQSLYEMAEELDRYMKSQQTFFQNASHELKTPLMTIQGYAEGIRDKIFDDVEAEKGLEIMVSEVKRLKGIINEMILLAKLDSEQAVYHPVELEAEIMAERVIGRVLPIINDKKIRLESDLKEGILLKADPEKLLQALLNICFNGIRHAETIVKLTVKKEGLFVLFIVEDDGEGISEQLIPHIFHRFVKGKNGEIGLGLAISRAIIEQSGGKIIVEKSTFGGAKFIISLPVLS